MRRIRCDVRSAMCGVAMTMLVSAAGWAEDAAPSPAIIQLPANIPPSPSTAPGKRIWPNPAFTHWPAVAYPDEQRHIAFSLPNRPSSEAGLTGTFTPFADSFGVSPEMAANRAKKIAELSGKPPPSSEPTTKSTSPEAAALVAKSKAFAENKAAGKPSHTIAWEGQPAATLELKNAAESVSGLLFLPTPIGTHRAMVSEWWQPFPITVRIIDAREPWPLTTLTNGFPVDEHNVPVVLQDRRRHADDERRFTMLAGGGSRPSGRAWLVGDPLEAFGTDTWTELDAERKIALDERYPQHAVLVALAPLTPENAPRSIVWSPGNQVLYGGAWSAEEERLMGALNSRCEHLGIRPTLILALPPLPVEERLQAQASERRELLTRCAVHQGWIVVDLATVAGDPAVANRVADHAFTRYPLGNAQLRMRKALASALAR